MSLNMNFREFDLDQLKVHPRIQRELDEKHVRKIVENFNVLAVNPIVVMETEVGVGRKKREIIDGQHTFAAAKEVGHYQLWCKVIEAKNDEEANEIFRLVNQAVRPLSVKDSFEMDARIIPGSDAHRINEALEARGFKQGRSITDPWQISVISQLRIAWKRLRPDQFDELVLLMQLLAEQGHKIRSKEVDALSFFLRRDPTPRVLLAARQSMPTLAKRIPEILAADMNRATVNSILDEEIKRNLVIVG